MSSQDLSFKHADPAPEAPGTLESDALKRLARLQEEFKGAPHPEAPETAPEQPASPPRKSWSARRGVKSLLALALAIAIGWIPIQRLLATTSAEATVNARVINLRAPIDGRVQIVAPTLAVGSAVEPGEKLLKIANARADRGRLDDLRRTVSALTSESVALTTRLDQLRTLQTDLRAQRDAFQEGRIRQLEAKAAELQVQITSAEAQHDDAEEALERSKKLNATGSQTIATLLHAERDYKVSKLAIDAARLRLQGNQIELDAARKGLFVGDSYNDLPRSAQRLDEISQQIVEASSQLDERKSRLAYLKTELDAETKLFEAHSSASVDATVHGRVWEVLTANGEEVRVGQELLRVLDCGGAVVTATVSEGVFNKLYVGQTAHFHLRGESQEYAGTVASLTGLAAAGSNFAIEQTALTREPYHVTIAVPGLAERAECSVGRTGQVTFDTSATAAATFVAAPAAAAEAPALPTKAQ
jgi:multidrug resistance efflux pump